jgi:ubiquinone/menaquinone biosynthesis C-methylase UbiE
VTGLDISPAMLTLNPCNKLVCGSALELPFAEDSFDLVFCANLLHHLDDPGKALGEMVRVSRNCVVLIEPNRNNPILALFLAVVPRERRALKFTARYMTRLVSESLLRIDYYHASGFATTNRTPKIIVPLLRLLEKRFGGNMFHTLIAYKK